MPMCNPIWLDVAKSDFTQVKRAQGGRRKFPIGNYDIIGVKNKFAYGNYGDVSHLLNSFLNFLSPFLTPSTFLSSSQLFSALRAAATETCPIAKDSRSTHTATSPRNLDAAAPLPSTDTELQKTKKCAMATEIVAPKLHLGTKAQRIRSWGSL